MKRCHLKPIAGIVLALAGFAGCLNAALAIIANKPLNNECDNGLLIFACGAIAIMIMALGFRMLVSYFEDKYE